MSTNRRKPFVFVLMPFDPSFDDVYKLGIKDTCKNAGMYCERVDEQLFHERILDRIYNQISKADIIVADMTGRNPNVFYETGFAHGLGKRVVLITKDAEDIPFDLKDYPHIIYKGRISDLIEPLTKKMEWSLATPEAEVKDTACPFVLYIDGTKLALDEVTHIQIPSLKTLFVDLHNKSNKRFSKNQIKYGIVRDANRSYSFIEENAKQIKQPDGRILLSRSYREELYPDEWANLITDPYPQDGTESVFKLFLPTGSFEFPLRITLGPVQQRW